MGESADLKIRKTIIYCEDVERDVQALQAPIRYAAVAAVLDNPWYAQGYVEDLSPMVSEMAAPLGKYLAKRAVELIGGADSAVAFGKAAMVGLEGEYEHASALIHTTRFGDECRKAIAGSAWMLGNQKLCGPGDIMELPLAHKNEPKNQDYYHTIHLRIQDAPRANELVVAVGLASGPRPHARLS